MDDHKEPSDAQTPQMTGRMELGPAATETLPVTHAQDGVAPETPATANGENGPDYTGGGSGGRVLIEAGTLTGSGSIKADGGLPGAGARAGGGVRAGCQRIHLGRHTLERRASLTEGEWEPVPGQTGILCTEVGPVILSDTAALPQAFYRVVATPPP